MNALEMLEQSGVTFRVNQNWKTARASSFGFDPSPGGTTGVIIHHTASSANGGNMPSENIVVNGRTGLRGPLSQFLLGRNGTVLLVSQNRCNHAGKGNGTVLENCRNDVVPPDFGQGAYNAKFKGSFGGGNGEFWGIEVENNGIGESYKKVQIEALVKLLAALCEWQDWNPLTRIIHHREWTRRKIDMSFKGPIRKMVADFKATGSFNMPSQSRNTDNFSARPLLSRGDKGEAVTELQRILVSAGFDIAVDGIFGSKTQTAVKAFQKSRDLVVDGKVGPATWASLLAAGK